MRHRPFASRYQVGLAVITVSILLIGVVWPPNAHAESVAEDLIAVMERAGLVSPEQAAALREKAALERETQERRIRDEIDQVYAEQVREEGYLELEPLAAGNEPTLVKTSLADSMEIGGYLQFLTSFADNESPVGSTNGNRSDGIGSFETTDFRETDGFSIRRARVKIKGNVGPRTKYVIGFDGDNIDDPGNSDAVNLNDAYAEYNPAFLDGTPADGTWIRAGQFYVPFSREAQLSSSKRLPIARSHFVNELAPFREPGVMVYNKGLMDGRLALFGSVTNGTGENEDDNDPFLWTLRAEVDVLDGQDTGLGPADWSVGAAVVGSSDGNGLNDPAMATAAAIPGFTVANPVFLNGQETELYYRGRRQVYIVDTQFDAGRVGLNGELIYAKFDVRDRLMPTSPLHPDIIFDYTGDNDVGLASDQDIWGFHVMPSFWIIEDKLQGYFKYEYMDFDDVLDADMWGTTVGLNYHCLPQHRSVVRLNWVHLEHESDLLPAGMVDAPGLRQSDLEQDFFLVEWQLKY